MGTAVWPPGQSVSFVPPGFVSVLSKRRCQICPPLRDVYAKQVVGYAGDNRELTRALGCRDALGHERRKQVVHRARLALELQLPQQLHAPDVGRREHFLVAHPAGPRVIHTLCEEVGRATGRARQQQHDDSHSRNSHDSSFSCQTSRIIRQPAYGLLAGTSAHWVFRTAKHSTKLPLRGGARVTGWRRRMIGRRRRSEEFQQDRLEAVGPYLIARERGMQLVPLVHHALEIAARPCRRACR